SLRGLKQLRIWSFYGPTNVTTPRETFSASPFLLISWPGCSVPTEQRDGPAPARLARPSAAAILFYLSSTCYVSGAGYTHATCGLIIPGNFEEQTFLRRLASTLIA